MSAAVVDAVYKHSRADGRAHSVLLAMAHLVSHERFARYGEALAWPSYSTLAKMGRCSPKTVERAVQKLADMGEIRWTGDTKGQGARVYEILVCDEGTPDTSVGAIDASTDTYVGGLSQIEDTPDTHVGGSSPMDDSPTPTPDTHDRTPDILGRTPDTHVGGPPTPASGNTEGKEDLETDLEGARAPDGARGSVDSFDLELAAYARRKLGSAEATMEAAGARKRETPKERNQREAEERELAEAARELREKIPR